MGVRARMAERQQQTQQAPIRLIRQPLPGVLAEMEPVVRIPHLVGMVVRQVPRHKPRLAQALTLNQPQPLREGMGVQDFLAAWAVQVRRPSVRLVSPQVRSTRASR